MNSINPKFIANHIFKTDVQIEKWDPNNCKRIWNEMWDNVFFNNVLKKDHIQFSKEWH